MGTEWKIDARWVVLSWFNVQRAMRLQRKWAAPVCIFGPSVFVTKFHVCITRSQGTLLISELELDSPPKTLILHTHSKCKISSSHTTLVLLLVLTNSDLNNSSKYYLNHHWFFFFFLLSNLNFAPLKTFKLHTAGGILWRHCIDLFHILWNV